MPARGPAPVLAARPYQRVLADDPSPIGTLSVATERVPPVGLSLSGAAAAGRRAGRRRRSPRLRPSHRDRRAATATATGPLPDRGRWTPTALRRDRRLVRRRRRDDGRPRLPAALVERRHRRAEPRLAISTRWGLASPTHVVVLAATMVVLALGHRADVRARLAAVRRGRRSALGRPAHRARLAVPVRPARGRTSASSSSLSAGWRSPSVAVVAHVGDPSRRGGPGRLRVDRPAGAPGSAPATLRRANRTNQPDRADAVPVSPRRQRLTAAWIRSSSRSATRSAASSRAKSSSSASGRSASTWSSSGWPRPTGPSATCSSGRTTRSCRTSRPRSSSCSPRSSSSSPSGSTRSSGRTRRSARSGSGTWPRRRSSPRSSRSTIAPAATGGSTTNGSSAPTAGPA